MTLGPFKVKQHQVRKIGPYITAIEVNNERLLNTNGRRIACLDMVDEDSFWVICLPLTNVRFPTPKKSQAATRVQGITYDHAIQIAHRNHPNRSEVDELSHDIYGY